MTPIERQILRFIVAWTNWEDGGDWKQVLDAKRECELLLNPTKKKENCCEMSEGCVLSDKQFQKEIDFAKKDAKGEDGEQ